MPNPRNQRLLIWTGAAGVLTSCFGCSLIVSNQTGQLNTARLLLIAGEVILVPIFIYLLILRNRASAVYTRQLRKREAQEQRELEALASLGEVQSPKPKAQSPSDNNPKSKIQNPKL